MRLGGATMDPPDQSNGLLVSLTRRQSPGQQRASPLPAMACGQPREIGHLRRSEKSSRNATPPPVRHRGARGDGMLCHEILERVSC